MTWWNGELSLNEQILRNLEKFSGKKEKYLESCHQKLVESVKTEILYQSSIGVTQFKIEFSQLVKDLETLVLGPETRKHTYTLTLQDRKRLLEGTLDHFNQKDIYPNIECYSNSGRYGTKGYSLQFKIVETPEETETKTEPEV